jgi:N-acetylglutamate synthase-like GNAT family acetyltransferase/quercetin dioxygenase-like cupin family protein
MFYKIDKNGYTEVIKGIKMKTLVYGEKSLLTELQLGKGSLLPSHSHPHEQTGYLISGRIRLTIGGEAVEMEPGDSWSVPGDVAHSAEILENSVAIEVFSPVREDYLPADRTDSNFGLINYRLFREGDFKKIVSLLKESELPIADLIEFNTEFLVAVENGKVVGCIGIEKYGSDGLLRSFAVDKYCRSKGIGLRLLQELLVFSRRLGIKKIHLLTTTAENYFLSRGFVKADRSEAPETIRSTTEFASICPLNSVYMISQ